MRTGRLQEAVTTLRRASDLRPGNADTHNNLGLALMQTGRPQDAAQELRRTVELRPGNPEGRYNLAQALVSTGQPPAAIVELRKALRLRPEWPTVMVALAWLQVTTTDPAVYNPEEALQLATRAAELSGRREVAVLDALAATYAAVGRFPDAVRTAEDAETLARSSAPNALEDIKARLSRYKEGRPLVTAGR
jgi:tetratricopeptide (TPR) repeat protein